MEKREGVRRNARKHGEKKTRQEGRRSNTKNKIGKREEETKRKKK